MIQPLELMKLREAARVRAREYALTRAWTIALVRDLECRKAGKPGKGVSGRRAFVKWANSPMGKAAWLASMDQAEESHLLWAARGAHLATQGFYLVADKHHWNGMRRVSR